MEGMFRMPTPERVAAQCLIAWEREATSPPNDAPFGYNHIRPGMLFKLEGEYLRVRHDPDDITCSHHEDMSRILGAEANAEVVLDDDATAGAIIVGLDAPLTFYEELAKEDFARRADPDWSPREAFKRILVDVFTRD